MVSTIKDHKSGACGGELGPFIGAQDKLVSMTISIVTCVITVFLELVSFTPTDCFSLIQNNEWKSPI